jgi:hypothetical protein
MPRTRIPRHDRACEGSREGTEKVAGWWPESSWKFFRLSPRWFLPCFKAVYQGHCARIRVFVEIRDPGFVKSQSPVSRGSFCTIAVKRLFIPTPIPVLGPVMSTGITQLLRHVTAHVPPRQKTSSNPTAAKTTPRCHPKWTSASPHLATARQSAQVVYKMNLSSTSTGKGSIEDMYKHSATAGVTAPVCFRTVTDTGNVQPGPASKQLQSKKPSAPLNPKPSN